MFMQFKRITRKASLLTTLISLLAFTIVLAAPGELNRSFNGDGNSDKPGRPDIFDMSMQSMRNVRAADIIALASGDLDTTFDGDGLLSTNVTSNLGRSDVIYDMVIQSDGKILVAGRSYVPPSSSPTSDFAVARYNANGTLDTTFSGDGKLITNLGGRDIAYNVAVQSNKKIVVSGESCESLLTIGGCDLAVVRYNPNGVLDTTFSGDGKVLTDFSGGDNGTVGGLSIQNDQKIVVAGYMERSSNYDIAVHRYNTDGSLDTTFSGDGMTNINIAPGRHDFSSVLAIQKATDGKIVVAGYSGDVNFENNDFVVVRLKPNGALDNTFSGDGKQITDFGGDDYPWGFAGQPDLSGKFLAVGQKFNPGTSTSVIAMARYNPDGSLDTTFNGTGKKAFSVFPGISSFAGDAVILSSNKKIVLTGGSGPDFAMLRLTPNGGLDATFSGDGRAIIDFGGNFDFAWIVALQTSDGKYVTGGYTHDGAQSDFALARVLP